MSNKLVDAYRADLASRGQVDPRDDETITAELGEIAQRNSPHLFDQFPDFGQQYSAIRDANAPGLGEEFGRAFKAGSQGLASTALGGLGLITGSDYLKGKAKSFDDDAAENAPTIPTLEDIAPGESSTLRKALSRDALRYGVSKFGSVAPSIAESAVTAAAGAAAGSAFGPEGTLAGAFGGVIEKSLVKSAIKKMVQKGLAKSLAEKGLISEASEVGIEQALKAGSKSIAADVAAEAAAIGGFKGGVAANALGSFVLNTGDVASEGADTGTTLALGALSAIPDTILPAYVLKKFFPGLGKEAAKEAGKSFLAKNAKKLAELVGVPAEEFGQEYFQEGVNVVARNMKEGKDPLTFTDADLKRLREAGIAGAAGGLLAAPGVMFGGRESPVAEQPKPEVAPATQQPVVPVVPLAAPVDEGEAVAPPQSVARQVALMTDDTEKQALFDQLTAKQAAGAATPDEANAIELLKADGFVAPMSATSVNTSSEALPVAENPITTLPTATDPAAESVSSDILPETSQPAAVETFPLTTPAPAPPEIAPVGPVVAESAQINPQLLAPAPVGDLVTPVVPTAPVVSPVEVAAAKAASTPVEQIAPVAPTPSLSLEQRLTNEIKRPDPVEFGPIASVDTTVPANVEELDLKGAMDATGSRSSTRVAVILRANDGSVVMAGLLPRRQISAVDGTTKFGVGVQFFGTKKGAVHSIKEGGKVPALLSDVVAAGYTYVGKVNFDAAPGKIFQRWSTPESFQAALTKAAPVQTSAAAETSNREAVKLDAQANALVAQRDSATPARQLEIDEELADLRSQSVAAGAEPQFSTAAVAEPTPLAIEADYTNQLAIAAARLRQFGGRVDILARSFLQQSLARDIQQRIDDLNQRAARSSPEQQAAIQARIAKFQQQLDAVSRVRGVAYTPWHMAIGLNDILNANVGDLATLIHEGAHTILGRDPLMQGRVLRAVQASAKELRAKLEASQSRSGMREANLNDPEELIVSTLGQQLALEGIPDSSSLARAVWGWVKDLYYRMAMAIQEAFGAQPDSKLALAWFENQLRRVVGGDYDYRFASLVDRFKVEARQVTLRRLEPFRGTPGGMADYFDPISNGIRQPTALPTSTEAVEWNQKYATEADAQTEDGQEIPGTEARARIDAAALNELADLATKLYGESGLATAESGQLSLEQWWAMVHGGEMPQTTLANITVADAATARIGGERMTEAMNGLARVQAKALVLKFQQKAASKLAQSIEKTATAEKKLISEAKRVNKVEGELRDAEMHEATLRDALKENIHGLIKSYRAGLVNAKQMGELAQAVADAEQLTEGDVLPAQYQAVFKAVLADEIPIFQYVDAISKLDLNLKDLTRAEIDEAIADNAPGDEALTRLMEPKNKPLRVALTALAKMHADQIDMLQLRRASRDQFLAIHGDLRAIREATEERLNQLQATYRNDKKAATFADRLKRSYVEKRAKLRKQQRTIQEEERRQGLVLQAQAAIKAKIDEMETSGLAHPSEWRPAEGATYLAMVQGDDGKWRSREKTLRFNRDGTSVNAAELLGDLASNRQYLLENKAKAGARTFQSVERQVSELSNLDVQRAYPEATKLFFEKWIMSSAELILSGGGAGAALAAQMLKRWQFITFSNWRNTLENPAEHWVVDLKNITKAAGLKETSEFLSQVYDPVVYFIGTEPGLEEGPALREAVRAARRRLTTQPSEQFDEMLKEFLRKTRAMSQAFVKIAEDAGVFIEDDRLGGELRKAVSRGWLTVIRRMNSATVSTIVRDMERAGWALEFADAKGEGSVPTSFDKGVSEKRRVIKATTFDALMPALAPDEQQAAQRTQILETPQLFSQAISGFFSPGVIQRWLAPFINKPGDAVFSYQGSGIDQLEVQQAWQNAGGNVAAWIDALGQRIGVGEDTTTIEDADEIESALSPQASWRASMLRQMDDLYLMESRLAADANQVRNLFDASGKPAHLLMDARENDKLPPEHIEHMTFDPINTRNLLATIAFHAAFGRNGVAMEQAFNEITSDLGARKAAFDSLKGSDAKKKADAKALGMDYADLHKAARVYRQVTEGMDFLKAQFGFGNQAGVLTDMRGGLTVLHFIAQQTTNNPKTGLLNMLQLAQRPIARRTLDLVALRDTAASAGEIGKQFFGQLFESFGLHLMRASQHARDIGDVQGQMAGDVSWAVKLGSVVGKRGEELPTAIKTLRSISALQSKGARIGWGEAKEFPRMANIPFLSNTMQAMSLAAAISNGTAEARSVESLVHAAVQYFASNPEALNDPTFKLTAKDLRMTDAAWFHSPGSFEYMRRALVDYGIGNLEQVAREASERMTRGEPVLTKDQVLKAAMMSNNELDLQGSINTSPGIWASNPILKFATPLLGWPIRQMAQMNAAMRQADGRASALQAMKTIGILAAWSLPMGLAFTLMTDWYDDKILKKKSQLGTISPLAALPVVGPALALATSDLSVKDQGLAMFQRLSRAGNIYGLGADFVSSTLAGLDPTSGQRPFSLDSRILAFSQLLSIQQAISNWINSGFTTTYASVERPLIASIGGNGALSAVDIFAGALGIDIQETRIVQRTNVNQWLRAAGRETGLELKKGGGAAVAPSATGVWTREMWLGALTNDRLTFLDSYRRAIAAAREDGEADPEKAVLESWRARNPLNVFGSRPTQQQLQKALAVMSDSGRGAVSEALRLYDAYTGMIAPSPIERAQATAMRAVMRVPNSDSIRREMASMALR